MGNDVGRGDNSGKGNIGTERDTDTDADSGGDRNAGADTGSSAGNSNGGSNNCAVGQSVSKYSPGGWSNERTVSEHSPSG